MSSNELPQGLDPTAGVLVNQIEQNHSNAWREFTTAVSQRPELLQQVQGQLLKDGYHLVEYSTYRLPQTQVTGQPVGRTQSTEAVGAPTTYPGVLFQFGPSPSSSAYHPTEQQTARQEAPIQQRPQTSQDYHPGVIQRSELPVTPTAPTPQSQSAGEVNNPAVKAADDIARKALELKESHGDYWKLIHDDCYSYYKNQKDGMAAITFQKELDRKLTEEHILGGRESSQTTPHHHPEHKEAHQSVRRAEHHVAKHKTVESTPAPTPATQPEAAPPPAQAIVPPPTAPEAAPAPALPTAPSESHGFVPSPEILKAWQKAGEQQTVHEALTSPKALQAWQKAAEQQAVHKALTSPKALQAWQKAAEQQAVHKALTSPEALQAWQDGVKFLDERHKKNDANLSSEAIADYQDAQKWPWDRERSFKENVADIQSAITKADKAVQDGTGTTAGQMWTRQHMVETLLYNDSKKSLQHAEQVILEMNKLNPGFLDRKDWTDWKEQISQTLHMQLLGNMEPEQPVEPSHAEAPPAPRLKLMPKDSGMPF